MSLTTWLNGYLVSAGDAKIDPSDRGLLLGDGLFETIRVKNAAPINLERHLGRFRNGASLLEIPIPFDDYDLTLGISQLIAANPSSTGVVRLTLTAGPGIRGLTRSRDLRPTLLMTASVISRSPRFSSMVIARSTRRNEHSPLCRVKVLGYGDQILARREAEAQGADDAIMLNTAGELVCATAANILLRQGRTWFTPPVASGALPGITRGMLIEVGLVSERPLFPADLLKADQLLLVNALGVREVARAENVAFRPRPELILTLEAKLGLR